ncbi:UNVERIFIED_CONTAM: hypothetical protein FKN15_074331 [Acipenser sinensis]
MPWCKSGRLTAVPCPRQARVPGKFKAAYVQLPAQPGMKRNHYHMGESTKAIARARLQNDWNASRLRCLL